MDDYLQVQSKHQRPRTLVANTHYLKNCLKPLHGLPLASVTRAMVAAELRRIGNERGPASADCARSKLSALFAWAVGEGLRDDNPVIGTNKAQPDGVTRDRVLTDAEMVAVWNAADPATHFGKIVRLLFLTGCRRNEIGKLRASEVALEDSLIALPGERTKNALPHDVPLSGPAIAIAESLDLDGSDYVFGRGKAGFNNWDRAKDQLDAAAGVSNWRLHDIRRTVATGMNEIGVQPHIVEAVLNHVSGHKRGVAGIYNRAAYAKEKRAAVDTWASHLQTLLFGADNVHRITRKAV